MKQLTNNSFSKQKGFTLIELVVVIVILGILAATAAPKFIDLTGDARLSVMKGVQGSIYSAVNLAHAKALVAGQTGNDGVIEIGSKFYALEHGYPVAKALGNGSTNTLGLGIEDLIELEDASDILFTDASPTVITHSGATADATCQLTYTNAVDSETPPVLTATALTAC
ncbi:prepilin-type N-terminal cleavage/methylation domain-containing protein [Colwellia sp. MB02u-18]|uniref:pilus assembly FimT family protein n=1 Tax=unclassified Colwellia TaxID=196834 RepID=UPI0015F772CC|nr:MULTISPECIES: prepilin-type N-terminal cleavage/methylation domain-containing protein [unclassified Colwellia]MBA6223728.1 prepilin-type N-terminal cleavage/methylation domain-containing protein [Colwellia sp. MB3u-45]MBA6268458.1 prepilin-type N-terminal cleavage/methylation domain-containing protein [Colwellia sp. MB3u-43]MBA6319909.1 prepilin-type N-terminal cleavage/methylation domain-containing protein [Colwellia sp. MB02u-19]MBA6324547.1 prepilin-type N-terminal cleavage/methylation do